MFSNKPETFIAIRPFVARVECVFGDFQDDSDIHKQRIDIKRCVKLGKSFTETRKMMLMVISVMTGLNVL